MYKASGIFDGESDQEATAGLRVIEQGEHVGRDRSFRVDIDRGVVAIVVETAGDRAGGNCGKGSWQGGDEAGIDFEGKPRGESHFAGVSEEAEAGDVGAAVDIEGVHSFGGKTVEGQHGFSGGSDLIRICQTALEGGGDDAGAESFGEYETIPGTGVGVGTETGGVDKPGDGVAKFDGVVGDRMASEDGAFGFLHLRETSGEDGAQSFDIVLGRVAKDREGSDRFAAHGIDVAEGVGGGDSTEFKRVVDDGGEEVESLYEGAILRELVDAGIVRRFKPEQYIGIFDTRKRGERLRQDPWR